MAAILVFLTRMVWWPLAARRSLPRRRAQTAKLLADIYPDLAATAGLASYDPCWTIMLGLEGDHGLGTAPLRDDAAGIALGVPEFTRSNQQSGACRARPHHSGNWRMEPAASAR